jgi:CheY-like chemotaxis protein
MVLSDVVRPRMGGKELDEALRSLRPELPLLFLSGYAGQEVEERGLRDVSWALRGVGQRTGWDSNPRYPCGYTGFRDRLLQPLGHLSWEAAR